jgi:hypothetical protein
MSKKPRVIQRYDGERHRIKRITSIVCCDCGLTHTYRYEVGRNGHLFTTVWRDSTFTRQQRRTKRYAGLRLPHSKRK